MNHKRKKVKTIKVFDYHEKRGWTAEKTMFSNPRHTWPS